ncbi:GNAT family N-acetyltransferase [Amycolatopsis jejuensis]|uniref:GNAT family N-acetyltransferase n=1 Tax=Amycolatopsis jejuensis TaxID=330084 RepID=UPI000526F365|nr:GNAT family N-acetyltransferase [Amycolatopsis jejuensis]
MPSSVAGALPVVAEVTDATWEAAFAFHLANIGEFVLPLTSAAVRQMVEARQLFAVLDGGKIVGLCYAKPDGKELDDVARWELGGLHLAPELRGRGIGVALCAIVIAAVVYVEPKPVMGYVHQANTEVRGLLERLGFGKTGQVIRLGPDEAPGYLRRDEAGFATADVFRLADGALARIGADLASAGPAFRLEDGLFAGGLGEAADRLRGLGSRGTG